MGKLQDIAKNEIKRFEKKLEKIIEEKKKELDEKLEHEIQDYKAQLETKKNEVEGKIKREIQRLEDHSKEQIEKKKKDLAKKLDVELKRLEEKYKDKLIPYEEIYEKKIRQLRDISDAVAMVENQILGERVNAQKDHKELEDAIIGAKSSLDEISNKIRNKKTAINSWKVSIEEKKKAYERRPQSKPGTEQWAKIATEIQELGDKINDNESEIGALEMQKLTVEQDIELARVNQDVLNEGVNDKPIEEDPRMKEVLKQKIKIEQYMGGIERLSSCTK